LIFLLVEIPYLISIIILLLVKTRIPDINNEIVTSWNVYSWYQK